MHNANSIVTYVNHYMNGNTGSASKIVHGLFKLLLLADVVSKHQSGSNPSGIGLRSNHAQVVSANNFGS